MWCAAAEVGGSKVEVTMDVSNRPCLTHNLTLDNGQEKVGDLSMEMLEHVLNSLVENAHMTVHIVQLEPNSNVQETVDALAIAFGQALKYCSMIDCRRSGATASSKGTLSV
jgi:imidazoleglycerol phosphate dehydratase HisB